MAVSWAHAVAANGATAASGNRRGPYLKVEPRSWLLTKYCSIIMMLKMPGVANWGQMRSFAPRDAGIGFLTRWFLCVLAEPGEHDG